MTGVVIVSSLALGLSIISLLWQAWSWFRSGAVVALSTGWAVGVGGLTGARWVHVTTHNKGRASTQVRGWGFKTPDDTMLVAPVPLAASSPLPFTLDAGAEGQWFMDADDLARTCSEKALRVEDLRAFVRLGSGKVVYAKRRGIGSVR